MPLDAGASLASFIVSVLGWYALIRNGIQLVYNDYHDVKSLDDDINDISISLESHEKELRAFQHMWMATSKAAPEALYSYFWGEEGYQRIRKALSLIKGRMSELEAKIKPYRDLVAYKQRRITQHSGESIPQHRIWIKRQAIKAGFIGMKKARCKMLIEEMASRLNSVKRIAEDEWKREHDLKSVDRISIRCRGICHLLVPLVVTASSDIDDLRESIQNPAPGHIMEMTLDIFDASATYHRPQTVGNRLGEPVLHPDRVLQAAECSHVKFGILTNGFNNDQRPEYFVQVRAMAKDEALGDRVLVATARDAFQRVIQEQQKSMRTAFRTQQNRCFEVAELDIDHPHRGPRNCVWSLSPTGIRFRPSPVLFKYKLAFELAQACFLFLNSSWFSRLCSCALHYSSEQHNRPAEFGLRIKMHTPSAAGWDYEAHTRHQAHAFDATPNGARQSATRSLRHLGLLLIELQRGQLIRHVTADTFWTITELGFVDDPAVLLPLQDVLDGAGRFEADYQCALEHCMRDTIDEHEMVDLGRREILLKRLYSNIVLP